MNKHRHHRGFTLIEVLAASLILGAGALVICLLGQRCVQNHLRGDEYEHAYRLLDELLDRTVACDLPLLIKQKTITGEVPHQNTLYQYTLHLEPTSTNHLYNVTAAVTWTVGPNQYKSDITTHLYDFQKTQTSSETPLGSKRP